MLRWYGTSIHIQEEKYHEKQTVFNRLEYILFDLPDC